MQSDNRLMLILFLKKIQRKVSKQKNHFAVQMSLFFLNTKKVHNLQKRKNNFTEEMNEDLPEPRQEMLVSRVCRLASICRSEQESLSMEVYLSRKLQLYNQFCVKKLESGKQKYFKQKQIRQQILFQNSFSNLTKNYCIDWSWPSGGNNQTLPHGPNVLSSLLSSRLMWAS